MCTFRFCDSELLRIADQFNVIVGLSAKAIDDFSKGRSPDVYLFALEEINRIAAYQRDDIEKVAGGSWW